MHDLLKKIEAHKEAILMGEIAALLHMFGKCSARFLRYNSRAGGHGNQWGYEDDGHASRDVFSASFLNNLDPVYKTKFKFPDPGGGQDWTINSFAEIPERYKRQRDDQRGPLLDILNTCHRMTSADEKGVVRWQQPIDDMCIVTPFGHHRPGDKIDPAYLDDLRKGMDQELTQAFDLYLRNEISIAELREQCVGILQRGLSQALGETREPANDVTLWAQSYGVASLYKPVLATLAMGLEPCPTKPDGNRDFDQINWRLLGFGWNGLGFVKRGRKPADILRRQDILRKILEAIQQAIEVQYPLGNLFYQDLNGVFLTFPGVDDDQAIPLVEELAKKIIPRVREISDGELWPFLTLSKPSRTLTMIIREIESRDKLAALPRVATVLSLAQRDGSRKEDHLLLDNPPLLGPVGGQDICPVCQFRGKPVVAQTCPVCRERRSGRQEKWEGARTGRTIWLDEVADTRNQVALLTLRFDLSRWLSGEWFTTIYSQTFDGWARGKRLFPKPGQVVKGLQDRISRGEILLPNSHPSRAFEAAKSFAHWVGGHPKATERKNILNTFFEESGGQVDDVDRLLDEIESLYRGRDEDAILHYFFSQNPSPARLFRIWEETQGFLRTWLSEIEEKTFAQRPQRLYFTTSHPVDGVRRGQTYRVTVPDLLPGPLVVLCLNASGQDFVTVDTLDKFCWQQGKDERRGFEVVRSALLNRGILAWADEETGQALPQTVCPTTVDANYFKAEHYLPYLVLAFSPVFCQVLLPADQAPETLRNLLDLFDQRFGKVLGKLPLHVGLLVAKRKFPLYVLLEAGQRLLDDDGFSSGMLQAPWWNTDSHAQDDFYGFYPQKEPESKRHRLTDLSPVDVTQEFWLTPGYFDFDFLGSTADARRLSYQANGQQRPLRPSIAYGDMHPRPFPLHRLRDVFDIWHDLTANLSQSQCHNLEDALCTKLEEWQTAGLETLPVFARFGQAVLCRSFGNSWDTLSENMKRRLDASLKDGLLLETLELFQHVIKEEGEKK
ncbi:MAG: CRISPR-associated protein Csx11 [Clostridia bacterium]|nr:MAG: CRISPR-associated protein Csx11 [Clostridia bacterium]